MRVFARFFQKEHTQVDDSTPLESRLGDTDADGDTPLHLAALGNRTYDAIISIAIGANINAPNNIGVTPIHVACHSGNKELLVGMMQTGRADLNRRCGPKVKRNTPLGLAVYAGHHDIVMVLIQADVDVNVADDDGDTPLHTAFKQAGSSQNQQDADRFYIIAATLVSAGANLDIQNRDQLKPLDICSDEDRRENYAQMARIKRNLLTPPVTPPPGNTTPTPSGSSALCFCRQPMQNIPAPSTASCHVCCSTIPASNPAWSCQAGQNIYHYDGVTICDSCYLQNGVLGVRMRVRPEITQPKLTWGTANREMTGTLCGITEDDYLALDFATIPSPWHAHCTELQLVRMVSGMRVQPRQDARGSGMLATAIGTINQIQPDGTVMVTFGTGETWNLPATKLHIHPGAGPLRIGSAVRIRSSIEDPMFGWAGVSKTDIGVLRTIEYDGEVDIEFGAMRKWKGLVGEVEEVEAIKQEGLQVTCSSGTDPMLLLDGLSSTFWESKGTKPHFILLKFDDPPTDIVSLEIFLNREPVEFIPHEITVSTGKTEATRNDLESVQVTDYGWTSLIPPVSGGTMPYLKIKVTKCYNDGRNCRINQLRLCVAKRGDTRRYPMSLSSFTPTPFHRSPSCPETAVVTSPPANAAPPPPVVPPALGNDASNPQNGGGGGGGGGRPFHAARGQQRSRNPPQSIKETLDSQRTPPPGAALAEGYVVSNRYELIKRIGAGGFGATWLANDKHAFGSSVVLKFLHAESPPALGMFENEAKKLNDLRHPKIPGFGGYFKDDVVNRHVLVMAHVKGKDLWRTMKDSKKPFSPRETLRILKEVLSILEYVHSRQVIHRDIKAENVVFCEDGKSVVLIDFGACTKLERISPDETVPTRIGTPGYMAPEVARGRGCYESDFYSLGAMGVCLLLNKHPKHIEEDHRGLDNAVTLFYRDPQAYPEELVTLLTALLDPEPVRRKRSIKTYLRTNCGGLSPGTSEPVFNSVLMTDAPGYNSPQPYHSPPRPSPFCPPPSPVSPSPVSPLSPPESPLAGPTDRRSSVGSRRSVDTTMTGTVLESRAVREPVDPDYSKALKEWTEAEVLGWLRSIDMFDLAPHFAQRCINGRSLERMMKKPDTVLPKLGLDEFVTDRLAGELEDLAEDIQKRQG